MDSRTPFTRRHPLLAFMLLACGFSWVLWLLMIAPARGWLLFNVPAGPWGSFGPLIAAWVLCVPAGVAASRKQFFCSTVLSPLTVATARSAGARAFGRRLPPPPTRREVKPADFTG